MDKINYNCERKIIIFADCPTSLKKYSVDGENFTVTRHFTGDKQLSKAVLELAKRRADREFGL